MTQLENTQQSCTKHPVGPPGILVKGSGITFVYCVLVKLLYFLQTQWNLAWVFRQMRLYRNLLAKTPGRKPSCISKWLQIPNTGQHCHSAASQSPNVFDSLWLYPHFPSTMHLSLSLLQSWQMFNHMLLPLHTLSQAFQMFSSLLRALGITLHTHFSCFSTEHT